MSINVASRLRIPKKFAPFLTERARFKIAEGGRGGGKTENTARCLLIRFMQEEGSDFVYLITRDTQKSLKASSKAVILSVIREAGLSSVFCTSPSSKEIVCLWNRAVIMFEGLRTNPEGIKSIKDLRLVLIEEANVIKKETWQMLEPSVRGSRYSEIWAIFNPHRVTDYVYDTFVANKHPDSLVLKVNYSDNPFFPEVLERSRLRCKATNPRQYAHIWEGKPGHVEGQIFNPEWWRFFCSIRDIIPSITGLFITADTAYMTGQKHDYTVMQLWGWAGRERLYLLNQKRLKAEAPEAVKALKDFYKAACELSPVANPFRVYIEAKASGISIAQTLRREGVPTLCWKPKDFSYPSDKVGRANESAVTIENGSVYLHRDAHYTAKFLEEVGDFADDADVVHDDQVDALTMAISVYRRFGGR